jgi:F-type H+-transporting ATPase subunit b
MQRKIVLLTFVFSTLTFWNGYSAESGGMPQLNPEFWISQIFWLIISFGILFVILSKFILPKIRNNIELRKSQILDNIETAEKQKDESENKLKDYENLILNSKNEAKNYFNDARKKIIEDINKKRLLLEDDLNKEIERTEKEVIDLIDKAPEKINRIAIETSSDLMKLLIGEDVNNSSISAIVEDLSKKNKLKYYGN